MVKILSLELRKPKMLDESQLRYPIMSRVVIAINGDSDWLTLKGFCSVTSRACLT